MKGVDKVPWSCREEWEYCRNHLFSNDLEIQRKSLDHLYVWKIRNSNLPIAVECTLILMEVKLKEAQLKSNSMQNISIAMNFESWYSMAIMRFLNLLIDSSPSNSMMDFAKQIGIPDWIVELRHTAAHGRSLPSLSRLKEATDICLEWLHLNYWIKGLSSDIQGSEEGFTLGLFHNWKTLKQHLLRGCSVMSDMSEEDRKLLCNSMPEKTKKDIEKSLDSWLLEDAYKIIFKKFSRHLMEDTKNIEDFVDYLVNSDQSFITRNVMKNNKIRKSVLKQWADILAIICNSAGCVFLLKRLCNIIASEVEESWRRECAAAYINEILESILLFRLNESNENVNRKKKKLKLRYQAAGEYQTNHGIVISNVSVEDEAVTKLIRLISDSPNRYSQLVLKNLLSIREGYQPSSTHEKLSQLISIYNGENDLETSSQPEDKIHTLQELLGDDYEAESHPSEEGESSWSGVPLGLLPWQTEFHSWLQIYDIDETSET